MLKAHVTPTMLILIRNRTQGALCKSKTGKEIFQRKRVCHNVAQTPQLNSSQDYYSIRYRASKCFDATKALGRGLLTTSRNLPLPPQPPLSSQGILATSWQGGKREGVSDVIKTAKRKL